MKNLSKKIYPSEKVIFNVMSHYKSQEQLWNQLSSLSWYKISFLDYCMSEYYNLLILSDVFLLPIQRAMIE